MTIDLRTEFVWVFQLFGFFIVVILGLGLGDLLWEKFLKFVRILRTANDPRAHHIPVSKDDTLGVPTGPSMSYNSSNNKPAISNYRK
jgi:hypothetical protein